MTSTAPPTKWKKKAGDALDKRWRPADSLAAVTGGAFAALSALEGDAPLPPPRRKRERAAPPQADAPPRLAALRDAAADAARDEPPQPQAEEAAAPPAARPAPHAPLATTATAQAAAVTAVAQPATAVPCSPFKRLNNTCFAVAGLTLLASLEGFADALRALNSDDCCALIRELQLAFDAAMDGGSEACVSLTGFLGAMVAQPCISKGKRCEGAQSLASLRQPRQQRQHDTVEFVQALLQHVPATASQLLKFSAQTVLSCSECRSIKPVPEGLNDAFIAPVALGTGSRLTLNGCLDASLLAAEKVEDFVCDTTLRWAPPRARPRWLQAATRSSP